MSRVASISGPQRYGIVRVCEEWGFARSTLYAGRARALSVAAAGKRGPKTAFSDATLLGHIRAVLQASPFLGEGHRKVWARLRHAGIRAGKPRILRVMREHGLLAPYRQVRRLGPRAHDGTITTAAPDLMWGTDATGTYTLEEGYVTVFVAVDHCNSEAVGLHAAKRGTRFEALEPLRQGIRRHFGRFAQDCAQGLSLRHDHGSQYMSAAFQAEIAFLGMQSSPSFVRAPEGNGVAERFIRTLKEQLLWVHTYRTVAELNAALQAWLITYNASWLIERHGYRTPAQVRCALLATKAAA